jgi:flagellar protein FlgJ
MPVDPIDTLNRMQFQPQSTRSTASGADNAPGDNEQSRIEKACRDFESLFVHQMMKQMRRTVPQDGLFSGGNAEKMYSSMLDGEIAKTVTEHRGIGLAPALIRQMLELSEQEKKMP